MESQRKKKRRKPPIGNAITRGMGCFSRNANCGQNMLFSHTRDSGLLDRLIYHNNVTKLITNVSELWIILCVKNVCFQS